MTSQGIALASRDGCLHPAQNLREHARARCSLGTDYSRQSFHAVDVTEGEMPAKSKAQQKAGGAVLSAKRGEQKASELKGPAKSMYKSMSEGESDKMASTKRKNKPQHASKNK